MRNLYMIGTAMLALAAAMTANAVTKPREANLNMPPIWQQVEPADRLAAIRVAELDATRLLLERIYGISLSADTSISDFALMNDRIRGEISRLIKGVATSEQPEYRDDGQVWVVRKVKLRQIIETVTASIKQERRLGRMITVENLTNVEREHQDTVISVLGNGAIPGSEGMRKIQAKRAAEMDAYRKLAERVNGVQITATTTVRDFVLESDELRARIASQIIKGAKPIDIAYSPDGSCEVTMQLTLADIYQVIKTNVEREGRNLETRVEVEREIKATVLTEVGRGAPRPVATPPPVAAVTPDAPAAAETVLTSFEIVSRTLVGQGVVID